MALHSPEVYAQIVDSYIDGYRKRGWMPECRANNLPGWTQGGELAFFFLTSPEATVMVQVPVAMLLSVILQ